MSDIATLLNHIKDQDAILASNQFCKIMQTKLNDRLHLEKKDVARKLFKEPK